MANCLQGVRRTMIDCVDIAGICARETKQAFNQITSVMARTMCCCTQRQVPPPPPLVPNNVQVLRINDGNINENISVISSDKIPSDLKERPLDQVM